jgi:hypothetical protein
MIRGEDGFPVWTRGKRMNQFRQTDGRERCFLVAGRIQDSLDKSLNRFASTFRSDDDAGIED